LSAQVQAGKKEDVEKSVVVQLPALRACSGLLPLLVLLDLLLNPSPPLPHLEAEVIGQVGPACQDALDAGPFAVGLGPFFPALMPSACCQ